MKKLQFIVLAERNMKDYFIAENHIVISITSGSSEHPKLPRLKSRIGLLQLKFSDIDREIDHPQAKLFTKEQAKRIWDFFKQYKSRINTVICQCEAGISRSSATAAALAKAIGQSDEKFFRYYIPNKLVYRMILEEANRNVD